MKIALINIYSRQDEYQSRYSLATMRLAEYVMSFGYDVDLIPIDINNYQNVNLKGIEKYDLIGLSNYSWVDNAIRFVDKLIKIENSSANIVIGGPQVENVNLEEWDNEYFIIGEGEKTLLNLVRYIENGKKDEGFFENNVNIFTKKNPKHKKIEQQIQVCNPLFTRVISEDRDFLWYETCRGCAYSCGYCGHKTRKKVGYFDIDVVEKEIKQIGEYGFKKVFVIDPNFAGNRERAKKVIEIFNKFSPDSELILYLRPEFIDDEAIELYKKANIEEIRIGIQTTNKNVPLWIRSNSLKHVNEELPKLSKNEINWRAELIVGLPGDDYNGLKNSISYIESLKPTTYYCYHLTLIKGVKLYSLVDNFENNLWITKDEFDRAYSSSTYSHEELLTMLEYSDKKEKKYNEENKRKLYLK
jgi:hypothetical protein